MSDISNDMTMKDLFSRIPDAKSRVGLLFLSIATLLFPVVSVKLYIGVSGDLRLSDVTGALAYLIPLALIASLVIASHPALKHYSRLADNVATGLVTLFLAWGAWELFGLYNQVDLGDSYLESLRPKNSVLGPQSYNSFSVSIGSYLLVILTAWSIWRSRSFFKT